MEIDWATVAAQIVNFLVLVWLLQHFLYGPITRAMQRREDRIRDRLEEADRKQEDADLEAKAFREKQAEIERRSEEIMEKAWEAARELRTQLEAEVRQGVEQEREAWRQQVNQEKEEFLQDIRARATHHFYDMARSALAQLADADLESQMAIHFADHLASVAGERRAKVAEAARKSDGQLLVESTFELSQSAKSRVTRAIHETIGEGLKVDYAQCEDLSLGLRLKAAGQVIEWSLSAYLEQLEEAIGEKLAEVQSRTTGKRLLGGSS